MVTRVSWSAWQLATGGVGLHVVDHLSQSPTPRKCKAAKPHKPSPFRAQGLTGLNSFLGGVVTCQYVRFIRRDPPFAVTERFSARCLPGSFRVWKATAGLEGCPNGQKCSERRPNGQKWSGKRDGLEASGKFVEDPKSGLLVGGL